MQFIILVIEKEQLIAQLVAEKETIVQQIAKLQSNLAKRLCNNGVGRTQKIYHLWH